MKKEKGWERGVFSVPIDEKVSEQALSHVILSSVVSILICCICLSGATWAWFSSAGWHRVSPIWTATYALIPELRDTAGTVMIPTDGVYALAENADYTVTLHVRGSAQTGFCTVVKAGEERKAEYTAQIAGEETGFTFTIRTTSATEISFVTQWGTYSGTPGITNGSILSLP